MRLDDVAATCAALACGVPQRCCSSPLPRSSLQHRAQPLLRGVRGRGERGSRPLLMQAHLNLRALVVCHRVRLGALHSLLLTWLVWTQRSRLSSASRKQSWLRSPRNPLVQWVLGICMRYSQMCSGLSGTLLMRG